MKENEYNDEQKELFMWDADVIRKRNMKDVVTIFFDCLGAYINCVMSFQISSNLRNEVILLWKEFRKTLKEENKIFEFLINNSDKLDYISVDNFITKLYELNDNNFDYYCEALDNINVACDMGLEWKGKRPIRTFDKLIDTDDYRRELYGFLLSFDNIKEFFGYSDNFFLYIKNRMLVVNSHRECDNSFYGINTKMENDKLVDMKLIVPKIINLETALINVYLIKEANMLYELLGCEVDLEDDNFRNQADYSEFDFKNKYLVKKMDKMFGNNN